MSNGVVITMVSMAVGFAVGLIRLGMAITAAERRAKHDAVNEITGRLTEAIDRKLDDAVYRADKASADRRLEVLERSAGLNGYGHK